MVEFMIVGADAAGLSAAIQVKRKRPDASIKVINKGKTISYGACGIPYVLSGDIESVEKLIHFTPQSFKEKRGIPVEISREATDIFPEEHEIEIKNLETGAQYMEKYKKLLLGTGAVAKELPFLDYTQDGIYNVHDLEDLREILAFLEKKKPQKAAIIGAGNIGLEIAEALHTLGKEILLFEILEAPVANWPAIVQEAVQKKIQEKGIQFFGKMCIKEVKREKEAFSIRTERQEFKAGVIFTAVGIRPATDFCGNKIKKMKNGALLIDQRAQTSEKDIYAAGDCASVFNKVLRRNVYSPLGSTANKLGRIAGLNMTGEKIKFPGIAGTQIFKFFELSLAKTGLSLEEAQQEGIEAEAFSARRTDRAGYYPGAKKVQVEIVCEKKSEKIIGTSVVGEGNAAQFVDPAAVAVLSEMPIEDLAWFDAAYTPPYAPVWNALVSAGFKAAKL
ncbi:MAG: FAD-dependent oxidoreductase [Candidatus Aminicenantes bacterium]|nr:FAD-dependent oxidoreductase [Candidatus Aminicenantes bacterium]